MNDCLLVPRKRPRVRWPEVSSLFSEGQKHHLPIHGRCASQLDLFDYKPRLQQHHGQPIPEDIVKGERFAFIKGTPKLLGSPIASASMECGHRGFRAFASPLNCR
jgi:hypothetical protein